MDNIPVKLARPLIVEFVSGPSAGKSTTALGLAYKLKMAGVNIEYLPERAKSFTWRGDMQTLSFQPYVTAKQMRDVYDLCREVNDLKAIITDTSVALGIVYQGFGCGPLFEEWVKSVQAEFDIRTYYVVRNINKHKYNTKGRRQTKDEAIELDNKVLEMLNLHNIPYETLEFNGEEGVEMLFQRTMEELKASNRV